MPVRLKRLRSDSRWLVRDVAGLMALEVYRTCKSPAALLTWPRRSPIIAGCFSHALLWRVP